jgi:hypothetical protein
MFLNAKDHTPPEHKANQTKRQIQSKTPTLPEMKSYGSQAPATCRDSKESKPNPFQMNMSNSQIKTRPLNQYNKSKLM